MRVEVPNVGIVEFPDSMSQDEVASAIKTKLLPQATTTPPPFGGQAFSPGTQGIFSRAQNLPFSDPIPQHDYTPADKQALLTHALQGAGPYTKDTASVLLGRPTDQPATKLDALHNSAIHLLQGAVNPPVGMLAAPLAPEIAMGVFAGLGARGVGEGLGTLVGNPQATTPQKLEQGLDTAQAAAMMLPAVAHPVLIAIKPVESPVPLDMSLNAINQRLRENSRTTTSPVASVKPATPTQKAPAVSSFDQGRVMSTEVKKLDVPAVKAEVAAIPTDQLASRYSDNIQIGQQLLKQGRVDEASNFLTRGQFFREEMQRRQEAATMPKPSPEVQANLDARSQAFKDNVAKSLAGLQQFRQQFGRKPITTPTQNEINIQTTQQSPAGSGQGEVAQASAVRSQGQAQEEVPADGGEGRGSTRGVNQQGVGGLLKQPFASTYLKPDGTLFVDLVNTAKQPGKFDEMLNSWSKQPGVKQIEGNVTGQARKRLFEQKGFKVVKDLGSDLFRMRKEIESPSRGQGLNPTERAEEQRRLRHALGDEGGFTIIPRGVLGQLFDNRTAKVNGQQLGNRLRNVLGEASDTYKTLQSMGLQGFLSQPRSVQELNDWAEQNKPQVEVRKFGQGGNSDLQRKAAEAEHKADTLGYTFDRSGDNGRIIGFKKDGKKVYAHELPDEIKQYVKDIDTAATANYSNPNQSHWQSIAPKSEQDMPGYVEIAVVKPTKGDKVADSTIKQAEYNRSVQFPSSHNFPPNTLGFVRGYMEKTPNGEKVFHVIEVQSDWAQRVRQEKEHAEARAREGMLPAQHERDMNDPLLPHYERLALKAAIEHARQEGATKIAISDAETAMMTEGHDRGNEIRARRDAGGNWSVTHEPIEQEGGMRLHYDRTLPKIAEELTGGKGERMEFGINKMALGNQINDEITVNEPFQVEHNGVVIGQARTREEAQQIVNDDGRSGFQIKEIPVGIRKDLIFRNPNGTPKTSITARTYDIGKNNPTPEFSLMGKDRGEAGFVINVPKNLLDSLNSYRQKLVNTIRTSKPKEDIVRAKDAADNMARIVGQQARKGIESNVKLVFGNETPLALNGITAAIEAAGDKSRLDSFILTAQTAKDIRATQAAIFARDNWDKLQPFVQDIELKHQEELKQEQTAGLQVGEREGYIKHVYDLSKLPQHLLDTFLGVSQGSGSRNFTKGRAFDTLYDAIKNGYGKAIKSWNAADLVENRLTAGQQMVNDANWLEGMKNLTEPTTKKPIVTELVKRPNGEFVPPNGYEVWSPFHGRAFAVHRGYRNLLESVTGMSRLREIEFKGLPVGSALMKGAGTLKHSMLLFDTYHAMRMTAKGLSLGAKGFNKGLSIVEYNNRDLDAALKVGDITKDAYDYAKANRLVAERLINAGLNVGRVAEGIDSEVIRHLPIAGDFNKWVFEKLTRGIMVEAAVKEYARVTSQGMDNASATKQVVKHINTYFGNLGRQGVFRSKTFQDMARLSFLAPMWVESMARTELGTIASIPRALLTGKTNTLIKGTSALIAAMFVATQIANLVTTGKPTWENEDGHQTDAWIPGGENGFYVSPFSLPMELTHDVIRYAAQGKSPMEIGSQIFSNKESPLFRAVETLKEGRDYKGAKLTDAERLKNAGQALIPLPLPLQSLVKPSKAGQTERQLLASAGIKAEPASGPATIVSNLRRQFLYKLGKANNAQYPTSVYDPLHQALLSGDKATVQKVYDELFAQKLAENQKAIEVEGSRKNAVQETKRDFQTSIERWSKAHGNASKEDEEAFVKTLTPHQLDLYKQVEAQQKAAAELFFTIQPKLAKKGKTLGTFRW